MKKFLNTLLGFIILFGSVPVVLASFTDVEQDHVNYKAISYLEEEGIIDSDFLFFPDRNITRVEFLKMAFDAANYEDLSVLEPIDITDVAEEDWFYEYVQKSIETRAFFIGPEHKFYSSRSVVKVEGLNALFKVFETGIPRFVPESFSLSDVSTNVWFAPIVFRAHELGVAMPRSSTSFGSFDNLSRGDVAELIYRLRVSQILRQDSYKDIVFDDDPVIKVEIQQVYTDPRYSILDQIRNILETSYFQPDDLDDDDMIYGAATGLVESVGDTYTTFLSPKETDSLSSSLENDVTGIGAYISERDGNIIIVSPISKSPAEDAGLKSEDIILKVDGKETSSMSLIDVVMSIRGKSGTAVKLTISRKNEVLDFTIIRATISLDSVEWEMKDKNVAYISVNQFIATTSDEFYQVVKEVLDKSPSGIIVDLRNNPGGFLDTAIDLTSYFLKKEDLISLTRDRYGNATNYTSGVDGELRGIKTVVLVNKGSASASEIMAGALQDHNVAKVIGQQTFGKGTAQMVQYFTDGSSLKFTVAKWFTPLDNNINLIGVTPDVVVTPSDDENVDSELNRAMLEF